MRSITSYVLVVLAILAMLAAATRPATSRTTASATKPHQSGVSIPGAPVAAAGLFRREEDPGSSCDSEGEWNCMGSSWQRCAAGQWSIVVDTAKGTKCTPEGIVDDISTEHSDSDDDDDDGNGNGSGTSGASRAIEGRGRWLLSAASCGIVVAVLLHV